jgi:pimeloyl-ACP methyl ester carboxylesterase
MKIKSVIYFILVLVLVTLMALPFLRSKERLTLDAETRKGMKGSFVQLPQGVTHYEIAGPVNGPVLVLIHGFSVPSYIWDRNFKALADSGFRVIRYDAFGRGFSDRPEAAYTAAFYHQQINDLLDALGIKGSVNIAGLSMGGAIATSYAADFPARVNKVILIDPFNQPSDISVLKTPCLGEYLNRVWFVPGLIDGQASDFYNPSSIPAGYKANFAEQMQFKGFSTAILSTLRNFISVDPKPYYERLGATQKPVLLMWGKQDQTLKLDKDIPDLLHAQLLMVESCGHLPPLEHPDLVNKSITTFLKELK